MKKTKLLIYIPVGVLLVIILTYGCLFLLAALNQGEYWKYENGVTIEVNNSTKKNISNIKFTYGFAENSEFQEIGTITNLKSRTSSILNHNTNELNNVINNSNNDISIYMHYSLEDGKKIKESIVYFNIYRPSKVVALIDITKIDKNGSIDFKLKGFDGIWEFDEKRMSEDEIR